jgi:hypothetical protein
MARTFKTAALLLPLHLAAHPVALALACGEAPLAPPSAAAVAAHGASPCRGVPIHWLGPGDDPALAALALVDALTTAGGGGSGAPAAFAAQRLGEVATWDVAARGAGALPGLAPFGVEGAAALLAGAGSLAALAGASEGQLHALCGGDGALARQLLAFFRSAR